MQVPFGSILQQTLFSERMDIYTLVLILGFLVALVFGFKIYFDFKKTETKTQNTLATKPKDLQIMDFVGFGLDELDKASTESVKIGMEKFKLTIEDMKEILAPFKARYNKLRWLKDNEGFVAPLINIGSKTITDLIKGFI